MKINYKANKEKKLKEALPSIQEQLDAIWEGGQKMEDMRKKIQQTKDKVFKK